MNRKIVLGLSGMLAAVAFGAPAIAQQMYRCGSTFQETPCSGDQPGKVIRPAVSSPASATAPAGGTDAACTQRGAASLRITWAREAGAPADKAIADVESKGISGFSKEDAKRLVGEVYQRRGSASEIRAAIEADCMAAREAQSQAAALEQAAAKARGETRPNPPSSPAGQAEPSDAERRSADARKAEQDKLAEARNRQALCERLNKRSEELLAMQRQGRSAPDFERLRKQRDTVLKQARDADCS